MKKMLFFVCFMAVLVSAREIIVNHGETKIIRDGVFQGFTGNFVIKNYGVLIVENSVFRNNVLGSKDSVAIFSDGRIVAPIINFGELIVSNSRFINNYSWNTALSDNFEAQAAAGAIANFGELDLADNNTFQDNLYQRGQFVVIRNNRIDQFTYIGNDTIFNAGNIEFTKTNPTPDESGLGFRAILMNNPVRDRAEILVTVNRPTTVNITILSAVGVVTSFQRQVNQGSQVIEWNLTNSAGNIVAPGSYSVRVEAGEFIRIMQLGVYR